MDLKTFLSQTLSSKPTQNKAENMGAVELALLRSMEEFLMSPSSFVLSRYIKDLFVLLQVPGS